MKFFSLTAYRCWAKRSIVLIKLEYYTKNKKNKLSGVSISHEICLTCESVKLSRRTLSRLSFDTQSVPKRNLFIKKEIELKELTLISILYDTKY